MSNFITNMIPQNVRINVAALGSAVGTMVGSPGKAVQNAAEYYDVKTPQVKLPSQKSLPGDDFKNGDTWGSHTLRETFTPSQELLDE